MDNKKSCIVIGAGMVGLCTALEFIRQGCAVTLVDRSDPGLSGATFGNAGFLATELVDPLPTWSTLKRALPMLVNPNGALAIPKGNRLRALPWMLRFALAARRRHVQHARGALSWLTRQAVGAWERTLGQEGLGHLLVPSHYLRIWETPAGVAAAQREQAFYQDWGIAAEFVSRDRVIELEPALANTIHHAVLLPDAHRISDPYRVAQALFQAFQRQGGRFSSGSVEGITLTEHAISVQTSGSPLQADYAAVCTGAHSAHLLRTMGVRVPLMAERGYHLDMSSSQGLINGPMCSADRNIFISPLEDGLRVVGISELGGLQVPPQRARFQALRHNIQKVLPQTAEVLDCAREWMGMRPTLPDSLPVIDTHPRQPKLGFAFGHQHMGITLAPITAQLICTQILRGTRTPEMKAYAVDRFALSGQFQ